MSDIIDRAQVLTEMNTAHALERQQQNATRPGKTLVIDGVRCCIDCRDPIPHQRLNVLPGASRCASCQEDFEFILKRENIISG